MVAVLIFLLAFGVALLIISRYHPRLRMWGLSIVVTSGVCLIAILVITLAVIRQSYTALL